MLIFIVSLAATSFNWKGVSSAPSSHGGSRGGSSSWAQAHHSGLAVVRALKRLTRALSPHELTSSNGSSPTSHRFRVAFTLQNLLYAFFGPCSARWWASWPGLRPTATIAMLLPTTRARRHAGAESCWPASTTARSTAASTTAILINVPGESPRSHGHRRYRWPARGAQRTALAAAGLGSFLAALRPTIVIAAFAPPLTELAFKFGPAEYFSLMVLGLIGAVVLASGSLLKAISMIILGLLLAQINTDVISGTARYSFDIPQLTDGIGFVTIAMGVFGFGEIIANLGQPAANREVFPKDVKGLWPTRQDFRCLPSVVRARHWLDAGVPVGGALLRPSPPTPGKSRRAAAASQVRHPRLGVPRAEQSRPRPLSSLLTSASPHAVRA